VHYLPTFRMFFAGGVYNDYRVLHGRVEFSANGNGEWRTLDDSDLQLHMRFKTPVSKWLRNLREHSIESRIHTTHPAGKRGNKRSASPIDV
jgi:hypothetical protein